MPPVATPPVATPPAGTPPVAEFVIASSAPADALTNAPRSGGVVTTFSVAPEASSINAASVRLIAPQGNAVPGALTVSGNVVTLTPDGTLLPGGTKYTVNYATSIKDTAGRLLNGPFSRSFTTAPQTWSAASTPIATLRGAVDEQVIASDKSGNVIAVWNEKSSSGSIIFSSRMDRLKGTWGDPVSIPSSSTPFSIGGLKLAVGGNGDAYVLWTDYAEPKSVRMARYVAATSSWNAPAPLTLPDGLFPDEVVLAVDGKGVANAVMSFNSRNDARASNLQNALYSARFDPVANTWSSPLQILTSTTEGNVNYPKLMVDGAGNLTLGWLHVGGAYRGLNVARYSAASGAWSAPKSLDADATFDPFALVTDATGGVTAAWTHSTSVVDTPAIFAARFDAAAATWSASARVSSSGSAAEAERPAVTVDAVGIATVVWAQSGGMYFTRTGPATSSWAAPQRIGTANPGTGSDAERFSLSSDVAGNVVLVYVQGGLSTAVQYSTTSGLWATPVAIEQAASGESLNSTNLATVVDGGGTVTAVWFSEISFSGRTSYRVVSNRFR